MVFPILKAGKQVNLLGVDPGKVCFLGTVLFIFGFLSVILTLKVIVLKLFNIYLSTTVEAVFRMWVFLINAI